MLTMWGFGIEVEVPLLLVLNAVWLLGIAMIVDEVDVKWDYTRTLVNWQEWVGAALLLLSDTCFFGFIWSGTKLAFWLWIAGAVMSGAGAFCWFNWPYRMSVMKFPDKDKYDRMRYEKRLEVARQKGDLSRIKKCFSVILRYRCTNGVYEEGSDFANPFDSKKYRSLRELTVEANGRKGTEEDKILLAMVKEYEDALSEKFLADYNAKVGVKEKK
jgi:hypothetical protein